jgi:hypothetical protein
MTEEPDHPVPRRRLPRWAVLWLVSGAVLAIAGTAALVLDRVGRPGSTKSYSCIEIRAVNSPDTDDGYCGRYVRDVSRRTELTQARRDALADDENRVTQAVLRPGLCVGPMALPPEIADCARLRLATRPAAGPPTPADATAVRAALVQAGFADAVVRIARPDDPASHGSIFFDVPLDGACFMGHLDSLAGGGGWGLVGRLPDGRC